MTKIFVITLKRARTWQFLCKTRGCFHSAGKTHVRDRIFRLTPIHASMIYQIPDFTEFLFLLGKTLLSLWIARITRDDHINQWTLGTAHNKSQIFLIIATLVFQPIYADQPQTSESMEGNNITSNLIYNASYSSFTPISSSTEEDPRILATSLLMYKIGLYGNKIDAIIRSVGFHSS